VLEICKYLSNDIYTFRNSNCQCDALFVFVVVRSASLELELIENRFSHDSFIMLDTLPTELTLKILDFSKVIEASKPILPPSSNSKQTILCPWCWTTIASLSLTCRTLRQITLPTLFSTLTIFPDAKYPQRLGLPDIAPEGHAAVDITALEWLDAFVRKADSLCNQLVQYVFESHFQLTK